MLLQFLLTSQKFNLEHNGVKFVGNAHHNVKDGDADSHARNTQRHDNCKVLVLHVRVVGNVQQIQDVDQVLWAVLSQQGPDGHSPSKGDVGLTELIVVHHTEGVQHSCHHHVFSYKHELATLLDVRLSVLELHFISVPEEDLDDTEDRVSQVQEDQAPNRYCELPLFALH